MKVTLLGCGTSVGVPALGHAGWGACNPADPRNRRQRCAVLVQTEETTVLVDAGPDIRNQLMSHELKKIDGVLITHTHSDHIAGLDDLRAFYWPERNDLLIHTLPQHAQDIETRFPYLFRRQPNSPTYFVPPMKTVPIAADTSISIGDLQIEIFHQDHGNMDSLGFLFNERFAYSTDVVGLEDAVLDRIAGVPLWIVEALRETPHQSHSHYEQTFDWIERVRPGRAVLTHLGLEADYETLAGICPENTEPGVDGMIFLLD